MGDEYIKREDAIEAFDPRQRRDWYTPWIVETLKDLPSADVAPIRHGRWINTDRYGFSVMECSECGAQTGTLNFPYCFNCGARMDGDYNE